IRRLFSTGTYRVPAPPPAAMLPSKPEMAPVTPPHHSSPEVEQLLANELCGYPPYRQRRIRNGFPSWATIRDEKRRRVTEHFDALRARLVALKRTRILPADITDQAAAQLHQLPRDSCFTRINRRCIMTGRRRGVQNEWRISRIMFRKFADNNQLGGVLPAKWSTQCFSARKHLHWPPPEGLTVEQYMDRYYRYLRDKDPLYPRYVKP
ncbi:hypothetical protein BOX15_Mlig000044g4, partial [Macrostomum lignano]